MVIRGNRNRVSSGESQRGKPAILPVRLDFNEPLVYPLSAYLNPLQWARMGHRGGYSQA